MKSREKAEQQYELFDVIYNILRESRLNIKEKDLFGIIVKDIKKSWNVVDYINKRNKTKKKKVRKKND